MNVNEIILYLRKSRKDYEFSNEPIEKTLERHEKILQEFALKSYGAIIPETNIFREVVSGDTIADRPEMQKALSLIEDSNYKAVLVLEIERLARGNTIDQGIIAQTFEFTNTLIITPQKIFDLQNDMDRSFFEDGLYQSRKYLLYTKKILTRGRIASVKEGKYIGSSTPFGYDKIKLSGEKGFKLVINDEEANVVRLIFNLYLSGIGTQNIAHKLNEMSIKARRSNLWTPAMVRNILRSKSVNGKVTWNNRMTVSTIEKGKVVKTRPYGNNNAIIVNGLHEAIIDDKTWNLVQQKISDNHSPKPPKEIKNPLAGIVKCKVCGHNMVRRPFGNGVNDTFICPVSGCPNVGSNLNVVEEKLLYNIKTILKQYEKYLDDCASKENDVDYITIVNGIKKEISESENQLSKVYELFEKGVYNELEFFDRKNSINNDIATKKASIKKIEEEIQSINRIDYSSAVPKIKNVIDKYDKVDVVLKNELLKSIISECYYFKQKSGRWNKDNILNFSLEIKLKI